MWPHLATRTLRRVALELDSFSRRKGRVGVGGSSGPGRPGFPKATRVLMTEVHRGSRFGPFQYVPADPSTCSDSHPPPMPRTRGWMASDRRVGADAAEHYVPIMCPALGPPSTQDAGWSTPPCSELVTPVSPFPRREG